MNKRIIIIFYIICINLLLSERQTVITGNHRTRDYIILQELYSNQSDSLKIDTNESTFDKNALMSLDIFYDVHINITDSTYTIHVMEKPNLEFIMPLIDKDETLGFSFGLGLYLNAIKGKIVQALCLNSSVVSRSSALLELNASTHIPQWKITVFVSFCRS